MPWWGWLIIAAVGLVIVAWITVAAIAARAARGMSKDMNESFNDFHKGGW